jgi:hypothetical protein
VQLLQSQWGSDRNGDVSSTESITSTWMPSLFKYWRKVAGRGFTDFPVPINKISGKRQRYMMIIKFLKEPWASQGHAPGLGTTTSKTSNLLSSHPFQSVGGTSQRRTSPSRKMHAEGNNLPSCSSRPAVVMDLTCTGGGISSARIFVS